MGNNKLRVKRGDPFGFWFISFERGQIPEKLSGAYTGAEEAIKAVKAYLLEKGKTANEITN